MKSIRVRLLLAGLAVVLGMFLAKSQAADDTPPPPMHHHGWGMGDGHMIGFWARKLNLTDEQKTQMKAVLQKEHPTMRPLFHQEHEIEMQLRQYAQGTFDEAKVRGLATQKAQVDAELTVQKTRIHNELYQLLTPEQQTQLKQMQAEHEAHMQQRMQEHLQGQTPPAQQ